MTESPTTVTGVYDRSGGGQGRLLLRGMLPDPGDPAVPPALAARHGLRRGDLVTGRCDTAAAPERGRRPARGPALTAVEAVDGAAAGAPRPHFDDLTPLHPGRRLRLETDRTRLTTRVIDLLAPIGKGQRGLIVAPPRTGKTTILQALAEGVAGNHPDAELMILLIDERPEEVTEFRRMVGRSLRAEVHASTFDRPAKDHIALADLAVERAKRLVERGRDVVILMDSLTRLCRAHNSAAPSNSRILTGGVAATALLGPKRVFGAARNTEGGGSLTILATALVDTGSRADDYYFEELKSTGNMELRLDRELADRRVFPAIDIEPSGTRREEIMVPAAELDAAHRLRRVLVQQNREGGRDGRSGARGYEQLLERTRATASNADLIRQIAQTIPSSASAASRTS